MSKGLLRLLKVGAKHFSAGNIIITCFLRVTSSPLKVGAKHFSASHIIIKVGKVNPFWGGAASPCERRAHSECGLYCVQRFN
jgi:hypothetical protein